MVIVEKSFPRGGKGIAKETANAKSEQIFGAVQRKIKKKKVNIATSDEDVLKSQSAQLLTYDTIQDGMIVMGLVKSVEQLYLNVTLPGRISARVSALEISNAYTKSMKEFLQDSEKAEGYKTLKELYRVGKIVYGRIKEVRQDEKGKVFVDLTLKPSDVHSELAHAKIKKGFVFNGAVEEIQEHGYIIESGIKGLRCFVPSENSEVPHAVGEIIYLKVQKISTDKSVSTCICKDVIPAKLKVKDQNDPNLDYLLPSTIVNFNVSKCLKNGLQGSIMNEVYTAYVNEHQLSDPLSLPEDYEMNANYEARILYVMPLTKFVYLTLNLRNDMERNSEITEDLAPTQIVPKPGDIIENAKVHHLGTGGIVLILKNKYKGIISFKTIKANYKGNYDQDEVLSKYAQKSKHTVRVLNFDIMDSVYICTDDPIAVNEKYFSCDDVKPGDFVTATVKGINDKVGGYSLQLGKINALIEKMFLAPTAKNLDSNTKLKCRVVNVNPERKIVCLTNRTEYMSKSSKPLLSFEEAKINNNYMGTVVKCNKTFSLVKFFGDVKGIFYNQHATLGQLNDIKEGQTMQFRIASKKDNQLVLGLMENAFKLGEICPVSVVHILDSGLEIKISYSTNVGDDVELKGLIPIRLLSDFIDLLRAKIHAYEVGHVLNAVCISGSIFSIRDVKYFSERITCNWKSLNIGDILKSYVKDVSEDIVEIVVPIRGYTKTVKVHLKMLTMNAFNNKNIELSPEQVVYVKVLGKDESTKTITVSAKLTDVWNCKMSSTADYLESYLTEISEIKKLLKKQNHAIARYSPGDKVTAKFLCVNEATDYWEYVLNETQVVGIIKPSVFRKSNPPKEGTQEECVVLWVDYSNMLVFLSNKTGDLEHLSNDQKIPTNLIGKSGISAKILFKNESIFVCSLKKGKNPVVFCPTRLHFNDFEYTASKTVVEGEFCKLAFIHDYQPIAVLDDTHKLWQDINRKRKLKKKEKVTEILKSKQLKLDEVQREKSEEHEKNKENIKKIKKNIEESDENLKTVTKLKSERKRTISEGKDCDKSSSTSCKKSKMENEDNSSGTDNAENKDKKAAARIIDVRNATNVIKNEKVAAKVKSNKTKINKKTDETKKGKIRQIGKNLRTVTKLKSERNQTVPEEEEECDNSRNTFCNKTKKEDEGNISASDSDSDENKDKAPDKKAAARIIEVRNATNINKNKKVAANVKSNKTKTSKNTDETKKIKLKPSDANVKTVTNLKSNRKRNLSEVEESDKSSDASFKKTKKKDENNSSDSDENKEEAILFYEDKTSDKQTAAEIIGITKVNKNEKSETPLVKSLTGVNDFWNLDLNNISTKVDTSDEDDDIQEKDETPSAKKKLTSAEKFKQQRAEEARLREIEEKYADPKQLPDSVDQFDRLVLSDPNNSKHWINYMVFHLQSTEFEKARTVARRALKTISFRNSDDLLNIWVALLNLELRYGSKETFDDTFKEALICNEPLQIYLRTVEIISEARKTNELIEIINKITKKFKTELEVWRVSANALFTVGMIERAQQLLHKALAGLPVRDHVNNIVMFANLNHRYGEKEMAQTLLDQVVTSYPKRVDVWCQYVDMLVKDDLIDSARNILERAVVQKIPLRKMRTIFKKYLEFEERFGKDANVQRVKLLAMDYVKNNEIL